MSRSPAITYQRLSSVNETPLAGLAPAQAAGLHVFTQVQRAHVGKTFKTARTKRLGFLQQLSACLQDVYYLFLATNIQSSGFNGFLQQLDAFADVVGVEHVLRSATPASQLYSLFVRAIAETYQDSAAYNFDKACDAGWFRKKLRDVEPLSEADERELDTTAAQLEIDRLLAAGVHRAAKEL